MPAIAAAYIGDTPLAAAYVGADAVYSSAVPFDPFTGITWFMASFADDPLWTPPADGAGVGTWRDGSGNARTPVQATGANQPLYRATVAGLNGRAGVEFDGTSDRLSGSNWASLTVPYSLVVIGKLASVVNNAYIASFTSEAGLLTATGTDRYGMFAGSLFMSTHVADTNNHLVHMVVNGASSKLGKDGTEQTGSAGTSGGGVISIGGYNESSNFTAMTLGFIGVFNGNVTTQPGWADWKARAAVHYGLTIA